MLGFSYHCKPSIWLLVRRNKQSQDARLGFEKTERHFSPFYGILIDWTINRLVGKIVGRLTVIENHCLVASLVPTDLKWCRCMTRSLVPEPQTHIHTFEYWNRLMIPIKCHFTRLSYGFLNVTIIWIMIMADITVAYKSTFLLPTALMAKWQVHWTGSIKLKHFSFRKNESSHSDSQLCVFLTLE